MITTDINKKYDLTKDAVPLIEKGFHKIYWVGTTSSQALRSNIYLIKDKEEAIIVDCGSRGEFSETITRIKQIMPIEKITKIFVNHQDPDVTSGMIDWLKLNPNIEVITSPLINILIQHYMEDGQKYKFFNTEQNPSLTLESGAVLEFIPSPFMHSPGAITIYDRFTKTLFSGDIWAAISLEWKLVLEDDFDEHIDNMDMFHQGYIASNKVCRNYLMHFKEREVTNIMPQHGSIILKDNVSKAFKYIQNLECGSDFMGDISDEALAFIEKM